jgi:hypothetical protein
VKQIQTFGDEREMCFCAHCGGSTETRDHTPSRVLLDKPYPENLPVVPCCPACNTSFSLDEEYVAVLVDCALVGSTTPSDNHREKVRKILSRQPALAALVEQGRATSSAEAITFEADIPRVENVVLKLARGHAAFELHSPLIDPPSSIFFAPLGSMTDEQMETFETPPIPTFFPEVGSRAMQRMFDHGDAGLRWIVAQEGRYRFMASPGMPIIVRFVLSEYLACEVAWAD